MNSVSSETSFRTVSDPTGHIGPRVITSQSDLLQVLTIIAMERPVSFSAEDIRDEKVHQHPWCPGTLISRPILGQSPPFDPSHRKTGYTSWAIRRSERQARLPR
jgi:hypothetical protein